MSSDLRNVQYLLDEFRVLESLRKNLEASKELIHTNPDCLLIVQAIKVLEQTIADLEDDERQGFE